MSAWCMSEDLQWKENDRKAKIGGQGRVSDEEAHQCASVGISISLSHSCGLTFQGQAK